MERAKELSVRIAETEQLLELHDMSGALLQPGLVQRHKINLARMKDEMKKCLSASVGGLITANQHRFFEKGSIEELLAHEAMSQTSDRLRLEKEVEKLHYREQLLNEQLKQEILQPSAAARIADLERQLADFQSKMSTYTPRRTPGNKTARILELEAELRASEQRLVQSSPPSPIQRRSSINEGEASLEAPSGPTVAPSPQTTISTPALRAMAILEDAKETAKVDFVAVTIF